MELSFVYIEFLHFITSSILEWQGYLLLPLMVPAAGWLFPVTSLTALPSWTRLSVFPLEPPHFLEIDAADLLRCSEISYPVAVGFAQRPGQTQRMCGCVFFWSRGRYKRLIRSVFESLIPKESPDQSAARSSCVFCLMKGKRDNGCVCMSVAVNLRLHQSGHHFFSFF